MLWDQYFYNVAVEVAKNSKCLSRKIGAVLVKEKSIIGTGYNGPPRGIPDCTYRWKDDQYLIQQLPKQLDENRTLSNSYINTCPRLLLGYKSGEGINLCIAGHAERNALINSARNGICTKDTKLYLTCGIPCTPCLIEIINAGVEEIIVINDETYDLQSNYLIAHSNLNIRIYDEGVNYGK